MNAVNGPLVSIVIPSFNQLRYLPFTIDSVLRQSYKNIEIIIVDGCSTDGSAEYLLSISKKINKLIIEPDKGQADAINKGVKFCSGVYVTWLNSDDILYENAITELVAHFDKTKVDFIYGDVDIIDSSGKCVSKITGRNVSSNDILTSFNIGIPQQGATWRKDILNANFLDIRLNYQLDRKLFIESVLSFSCSYLPITLGGFRSHDSSKSRSYSVKWCEEAIMLYSEMSLYTEKENLKIQILATGYLLSGYFHFKGSRFNLAIRDVSKWAFLNISRFLK